MSSAGKCPRALSAELLGYESEAKPEWLEQTAEEGKWHEERIITELEQGKIETPTYGKVSWYISMRQQEFQYENRDIIIIGHIEGKADPSNCPLGVETKLLEIKSMSRFEFDRWMKGNFREFPQYLDQIACYFNATDCKECLYIVKNRDSGYKDVRFIKPMEGYINEIISRLTEVANSVAEGKLFPAEFDIMSIECRRCDYKNLCIPEPTELDKATKEQLDKAVEDIRLGNRLVAEGKEFYDRGKAILKNHTKASNLRKWKYNNLAILLVNVKENVTYPKEALLAKYGEQELADIAKVKEAYDYLRLDDLEEKENG